MATPIVLEPKEQSQVVVQGNASKTPIVIGGNKQSGGSGGGSSALLEEWFEVTDSNTEILTQAEVITILEDIWQNT